MAAFIEKPTPQTVAENETAEFRCSIDTGVLQEELVQSWFWNDSAVDSLVGNQDFNQTFPPASDGGPRVHTLFIVARCDYNGTTVECFALFSNNTDSNMTHMRSGEVTLTIQGTCTYVVGILL